MGNSHSGASMMVSVRHRRGFGRRFGGDWQALNPTQRSSPENPGRPFNAITSWKPARMLPRPARHRQNRFHAAHIPPRAAGRHRRAGALSHRQAPGARHRRGRIAGRIVETEAYPPGDPTGYARPGLTTSNAPLVRGARHRLRAHGLRRLPHAEPGGRTSGVGAAVLIRALEPVEGIELMLENRPASRLRDLARGPGRVCAALGIGRELSGEDLCTSRVLWLERAAGPPRIFRWHTRIGLSRDQHRRLRFLERGSPFVSVPP